MDFDTKFKNELISKWTEKGLSQSSIKMYIRNLEILNDDNPLKNLSFLKNVEDILKKLEKYKPNTMRNYLISICSALGITKDNNKVINKLYDKYFKYMVDKNKELKGEEQKGEKTETQNENWLSFDEVKSKMNELEEKVNTFKDNKLLNETNYNTLLSAVVLALYVYQPPRRNDYMNMDIINSNIKGYEMNNDTNYLDLFKKEFLFNKFKTSKKEGSLTIPISENMMNLINIYMKFHPVIKGRKFNKHFQGTPFLMYYDGSEFDKVNCITRILNKIFNMKIGSSMLRHIYDTSKYGDVMQEMKEDAKNMSHSVSTAINSYIKK